MTINSTINTKIQNGSTNIAKFGIHSNTGKLKHMTQVQKEKNEMNEEHNLVALSSS